MRIIDTHENLRRNDFINDLNNKINNDFKSEGYFISISGILILYNNMLQSLFDSQIKSLVLLLTLYLIYFYQTQQLKYFYT